MAAGDEDRSRLLVFFAVAFAWSWTCWLLVPAIKAQSALAAGVLPASVASGLASQRWLWSVTPAVARRCARGVPGTVY